MEGLSKRYPALTFLADDEPLTVSQAWGAAMPEDEVPAPATFIVDKAGELRFAHFSKWGQGEWPAWEELQRALP
jgi:hypothetical protein